MATLDYWADATLDRYRSRLFTPSLDEMVGKDDPVRLVDETLAEMDWTDWEKVYPRVIGQPPIHPRIVASVILYGMYRGIRSTRKLEEACRYRFDFMWLAEGRCIDHTTFAKFRTRFRDPLKGLFKQVGRVAMTLGLIRLGEVAFDATRVKANNSRYATRTAKTLDEQLQALGELYDRLMGEMESNDDQQKELGSPTHLPPSLADIEQRREQVRKALEKVKQADLERSQRGINPEKNPAQVPTTDPDSRVMPNKDGGYAPNYTPIAITDGANGFIVDADVLTEVNENHALVTAVDRVEETFGQKPEKMLTDAGNVDGENQLEMERRGIEFYGPVESRQPQDDEPAERDDPTQPVPETQWDHLKRNPSGQLDKSCFVYVPEQDQYYCPLGHPLPYAKIKRVPRRGKAELKRVYRCESCEGCPLAQVCLSAKAKRGRTILRDQYEEVRERTAARMATAQGKEIYNQRPRIAETTFGILKFAMGIRQFLLRGLEKVKLEWLWAATAFNIAKLARAIGALRAELTQLATEG
jgi:transposase